MRLRGPTLRELQEEATRYRTPPRTLAEEMIEEGVKMRRHPGIVFSERGSGRRDAVLVGRPRLSVWQVIGVVRGSDSLAEAADHLSLDIGSVERAVVYYKDHPQEIEAAMAENEAAFERAKRLFPGGGWPPAPTKRSRASSPR